ncbi:MAG: DNA-directed RNA polymerase subunit beta' [Planctomycetota bacterium]|jgi:DNA-directed RNA polymerase subunit beta'
MEGTFDRINEYEAVKIGLASPQVIRSWSYGEVKKPETINYRTYRPEKDGLFCERIFGPERDWECACGRYKGIKHKGIICDRCGVKVTHSRVRRKRMGHITLAAPVVHIWFFKAMPNRLGTLLDMKSASLERVVYFQDYVVLDPGDTPLAYKQLLTDDEYRLAVEKYGDKAFKVGMGAESVREMLRHMDLKKEAAQLREDLSTTRSKQKAKKYIKRLKIVEDILSSENTPDWLVLEVIPVIPPDLRPLVLLDSGNFATSDLNDLYRRVINRNNRLKRLIELNAPEVIIRNEKRMLQQSVDALFDNGRCRRPVLGSSNRPLKSLTDMIKGKQGRFRENLLGKRVDYSARSVIVVGPELRLHQCGLPKKIALELYQPFIIRRLKDLGYADTIKSAKRMLERQEEEVWDILEEVIQNHPVLLNRAPTLHRMGIQAFQPVLVEGNAIHLHPLVCKGFNADFDGDQMAVHLPLSIEAQVEARTLMMSTQNIFSPASGSPIISPSQDMVLGVYWLTVDVEGEMGEGRFFYGPEEMLLAYDLGKLGVHARVKTRLKGRKVRLKDGSEVSGDELFGTTVGRVIFNDYLPEGAPFYNYAIDTKGVSDVIHDCFLVAGLEPTIQLLDDVKTLGFKEATKAGISFANIDMRIPDQKWTIIEKTKKEVARIQRLYEKGAITEGERYNQVVDAWTHAREMVGEAMFQGLRTEKREGRPYLNPIYMMSASGARGSVDQVRQLAGMRGLMAKPSGKIIETPILSNFREGLSVLEYFSSTHGGRKGLADTAIKTADSGYLTRKLVDVAQSVVITEDDCGTAAGIAKSVIYKGEKVEVSLAEAIVGRTVRNSIVNLVTDEVIVAENELITPDRARRIEELGYEKVRVRSPLTCESRKGICARCYGMDLSRGEFVEEGLAVGTIAAQSIGEPGTQLTLRTFHIGGTASRAVAESQARAGRAGKVAFRNLRVVENAEGNHVVLNRNGEIRIMDDKGRELEAHAIPAGAIMGVVEGQDVKQAKILCNWDPHNIPIIAEMAGRVRFDEIVEGETMREEVDAGSGVRRRVIIEHKGDLHPQIIVEDTTGKILGLYPIPERANIEVTDNQKMAAGTLLAKVPREVTGTQDITGGLPRVTELFEARRPKEPAIISEIDGVVELKETKRRGKRTLVVRSESGMEREHLVPHGRHLRVHTGDRVKAGEPLVEGPLVLQDILRIAGEQELQQYLLKEIQNVYRSQSVTIDDKHIEVMISRMMRRVVVDSPGDTKFLPGQVTDKFAFRDENETVIPKGGKPASARPQLLGITKAALLADSFISAASFQETTKVLTEAALAGKIDTLEGLKENVILGHLIPAGTGFRKYATAVVKRNAPPEPEVPEEVGEEKESELDRRVAEEARKLA